MGLTSSLPALIWQAEQRTALYSLCSRLGCTDVDELHATAHALVGPLHCGSCSLFLFSSQDTGTAEQSLLTKLSPDQVYTMLTSSSAKLVPRLNAKVGHSDQCHSEQCHGE